MPTRSEQFMECLQKCERSHDPGDLARLFDDQAELGNMVIETPRPMTHDAKQFWQRYLDAFRDVASKFTQVIENDKYAVLEWESVGHLASGAPIHYRGVSILEFGEDKIQSFRTYYNSAAFLHGPTQH